MEILIDWSYREADMAKLPIAELALFAMRAENLPDTAEVSIAFVDNAEMAALNAEYRGKEGPTDVLSFECDMDGLDGVPADMGEPVFELGDIIIAPDVAEAQTAAFGTTFSQEISLLLVHGILHLCGIGVQHGAQPVARGLGGV